MARSPGRNSREAAPLLQGHFSHCALRIFSPIKTAKLTSRNIAKLIAGFAFDTKADDIVVLDMRKNVNFCDYFVIATGTSDRRVRAIADAIDEGLEKLGLKVSRRQGLQQARWILLDTGDIVVHVFVPELREFYGIEHLWQDAPRISWKKK